MQQQQKSPILKEKAPKTPVNSKKINLENAVKSPITSKHEKKI